MSNYYCFVAGLPDLNIEDQRITYTVKSFKEELEGVLSRKDKQIIDLFYLQFDNVNLLDSLQRKEKVFDERGIYSKEAIEELIQQVKETGASSDNHFPGYFPRFIEAYLQSKPIRSFLSWEDQLSSLYYEYAAKCKNKFVAQWYDFNLNLNNILAANSCRKYDWDTYSVIIGSSEISELIRQSKQRDMGLTGLLDYLESVLKIAEENNLKERELQLDILRWESLNEKLFFYYFSVEQIFAYLVKLEIIERWVSLNPESGRKLFREIINSLKKEIKTENYNLEVER